MRRHAASAFAAASHRPIPRLAGQDRAVLCHARPSPTPCLGRILARRAMNCLQPKLSFNHLVGAQKDCYRQREAHRLPAAPFSGGMVIGPTNRRLKMLTAAHAAPTPRNANVWEESSRFPLNARRPHGHGVELGHAGISDGPLRGHCKKRSRVDPSGLRPTVR